MEISPGDGATKLFAQIDAAKLPGPCPGGGLDDGAGCAAFGMGDRGQSADNRRHGRHGGAGCLLVLNDAGTVVEAISGAGANGETGINGPWDMTALDKGNEASLFVTNVLNGTVAAGGGAGAMGTVLRIDLSMAAGTPPRETGRTRIGPGCWAPTGRCTWRIRWPTGLPPFRRQRRG